MHLFDTLYCKYYLVIFCHFEARSRHRLSATLCCAHFCAQLFHAVSKPSLSAPEFGIAHSRLFCCCTILSATEKSRGKNRATGESRVCENRIWRGHDERGKKKAAMNTVSYYSISVKCKCGVRAAPYMGTVHIRNFSYSVLRR